MAEDYNIDFDLNFEFKDPWEDNPTHILGYKVGALCQGKKGTRYEGIKAVIELWDDRGYKYWAEYRKVPVRYLENDSKGSRGIDYKGNYCNGISKVNFQKHWEIMEEPIPEPEPEFIEI